MNIWLLDFETTGLNVFQDDIIELAIKKFDSDITYHNATANILWYQDVFFKII